MKLNKLISQLQELVDQGYGEDEVAVFDREFGEVVGIEHVEFSRPDGAVLILTE